jgi:hypothetical protein
MPQLFQPVAPPSGSPAPPPDTRRPPARHHGVRSVAAGLLLVLHSACLDPLVDDSERVGLALLPRDAVVPEIAEAPLLAAQIAANDGLDEAELAQSGNIIPRRIGFAGGQLIRYWDFGPVRPVGATVYAFIESDLSFVADHPFLFDSIPGDPGYSPFWVVHAVLVRRERDDGGPVYDDQKITSLRALDDAIELGIVAPPEPLLIDEAGKFITDPEKKASGTKLWVNCPIVPPGTLLDVGGGKTSATTQMFARGYRVDVQILGGGPHPMATSGDESVVLPQGEAYAVQGKSSLEVDRHVFASGLTTNPPTPLVRLSHVRLVDDNTGNVSAVTDIVTGSPPRLTPLVSRLEDTGTMMNWPLQLEEGTP